MARRSPSRARPRSFRRTKAFAVGNLVVWVAIGVWYVVQPAERQADVARLVRNAFDSSKQVSAFDVAWDLWQLYAATDYVSAIAPGDRTHIYGGVPAGSQAVRLLANQGYVVGYSDALGIPLWAAYRMEDGAIPDAPPRPEFFSVDVRTSARIEPDVYGGSGYDRGHLAPSYAIGMRYGRPAQEQTFLMSNIVPQRHALNAGPWRRLEQRVALNYPGRFGEVWVIVGPVLDRDPGMLRGRVAIPEAFFMVVVDESEQRVRVQACLFAQETPSAAAFEGALTSVDEIESRTGLDLLRELPDDAERELESRRVSRAW